MLLAMKDLRQLFGEQLRTFRDARQTTQADLADAAGMSRATLANIESGRQSVSLEQLYGLASALACEPAALLPSVNALKTTKFSQLDNLSRKDQEMVMGWLHETKQGQ